MSGAWTPTRDTAGPIFDHMMVGFVVDNQDPQPELGRVRVRVPGIVQPESPWAFPMGRMLGVQEGLWAVPRIGASVVVFMNQGRAQHPYYMPGPYGSPGGTPDAPEQSEFSPDNFSIKWKKFHLTFKGTDGAEKITLEDLDSATKLEIDKTTGNYLRDVEGKEDLEVKGDRNVTVEEGDETHTVTTGKRTTTIQGDDDKTLVVGDEVKTITAGNKTLTMPVGSETKTLAAGSSTETMSAGTKNITALAINLIASGAVNVTAGGAVAIQGQGTTLASVGGAPAAQTSTGTTLRQSTGLVTETLLGGFAGTIVGAFTRAIVGAATWTVSGIFAILSASIQLGNGPYKRLVNEDFILNIYNSHTHPDPVSGTTGVPNQLGTVTEMTSDTTAS